MNIGNGFIDMGAKAALQQAFPEATLLETSGYPNFVAHEKANGNFGDIVSRAVGDTSSDSELVQEGVLNLAQFLDADVAVLPGCVLTKHTLSRYGEVLRSLAERDVPIVLLGASGTSYSEAETNYVMDRFEEFDPSALITRDDRAYDQYAKEFDYAAKGIDCAFFIDDWFSPPELTEDFFVSAFDKREEPPLVSDHRIVRPHHNPFEFPFQGLAKQLIRPPDKSLNISKAAPGALMGIAKSQFSEGYFDEENAFFSDSLKDYLTIYANSVETHSDRVHACVPTLVYGNPAQLHYDTKRALLFDRVTDTDIRTEPVEVDETRLEEEKERVVSALRGAIQRAV